MAQETMTREERIAAALALEKPDRVPVVPLTSAEPSATLTGLTVAQVYRDNRTAAEACLRVFDEYGGWDALFGSYTLPVQSQAMALLPLKLKLPGRDLPDDYLLQAAEEPILQLEDYDRICEMGFERFYQLDYLWRITDRGGRGLAQPLGGTRARMATTMSRWGLPAWAIGLTVSPGRMFSLAHTLQPIPALLPYLEAELAKRSVRHWVLSFAHHPFFSLCLMRSMIKFTEDLYYRPDVVERAIRCMTDELIPIKIAETKARGMKRWWFVEERASTYYYPLSIFERFWWPYTQQIVEAFWAEGIVTVFHLDNDWRKNLPYFRQLPRGSYCVSLDGCTDMLAAKEILRGHGCIYGDVSPVLLSIAQPQEVEAYVKRLIDEVGFGGAVLLVARRPGFLSLL